MHQNKVDALLEDPTSNQRLIGRLIYLTMTKPNTLHVSAYDWSDMDSVVKILKYIKKNPGLRLLMSSK